MMRGISASSGFPIGTAVVLGIMSVLGQSSSSSFWRYVILATVLFAEAYLILSPTVPLSSGEVSYAHSLPLLSSLLPYQQIIVLHQAFVSLSVCIAQLGPVLFPNFPRNDKEVLRAVSEVAQRIAELGGAAEHEVNRMIQSDLHALRGVRSTGPSPFTQASAEDDAMIDTLAAEMESVLIDARLRAHPVIGTMWERVADEARDRVTSAVSPINQGFASALPQRSFRVDKGIFTSPPANPASRNMNRMYHSRATSPITPTSPTLSLPSHVDHRPLDAESICVSESDQSETGSAATLLELDRRSRSGSPFTYVGPVRQRTVSRTAAVTSDQVEGKSDGQGAGNGGPMTGDGQTPLSSILTLRSPPHSLGKSSGNSTNQALTQGNGSPVTSGAKFFTSSFSKMTGA